MKHQLNILAGFAAAVVLTAVGTYAARAETPQPASTPSVVATEIPTPVLPTVAPEPEGPPVAKFSGSAWVNAQPSFEPVTAQIGDTVCGEAGPVVAGGGTPFFVLYVASDETIPGCGKPGAEVTFFIGGKRANQTAQWQATEGLMSLGYLVVGPPFAVFGGKVTLTEPPSQQEVVPFIGAVPCGYQTNPWVGEGPVYGYAVVVYPRELVDGCGVDGAEVTFKLVDQTTREVVAEAIGSAIWRPMASESDVNLVFTAVPLAEMPVAGGGGGRHFNWWAPALAAGGLLALGVATISLGRRSAKTV
ncbi:MAG: hypothetical protein QME71_01025 [Dehalococcoidia bacterium]|nr:hypothetical protein [Dehalococcoidia bacterium]